MFKVLSPKGRDYLNIYGLDDHDLRFQARLFGTEAHDVGFDRYIDGGRKVLLVLMSNSKNKILDYSPIASGVSFVARELAYIFVPDELLTGKEICKGECLHIADYVALGAHDARLASAV